MISMKEMTESSKGLVNRCASMNTTLVKEHGLFCIILLFIWNRSVSSCCCFLSCTCAFWALNPPASSSRAPPKAPAQTSQESPPDGDTWSVMHSWVLPTRSFLEFVMFARMFVGEMDAQMYDDHHNNGICYLSLARDKHCYSRVLELLINVWAYHSPRRMVYINPETGVMQEQHKQRTRKGKMWVKWFSFNTLKNMDEDLAEEADSDPSNRRWLWPSTGEVFWQGMLEKERSLRQKEKEKRRQKSKDKLQRMRKRTRQKVLGKYVKPPPEEGSENGNSTALVERR